MKLKRGFTLVELLVVLAIIGILATIGLVAFTSSQSRSRDAKRKSDLKQISGALELFNSDYGGYPNANASGQILACPYPALTACAWGTSQFYDTDSNGSTKTSYFLKVPGDPTSNKYFYRVLSVGSSGLAQKYQLFAHLENSKDPNCLPDSGGQPSCASPVVPSGVDCGGVCNYAVTSANTTPQSSN